MEKLLMVQAMDVSTEVETRADGLLDARYDIQRRRKNVSLITNMGISFMSYGAGFLALCWCARGLLLGQMSFGSLTAVIQLVSQLQAPFVNLSGTLPQYVAMVASGERLMELAQIQGEPEPQKEDPRALYEAMDSIRAEKLSFSYDRDAVLRHADFVIPKGFFVTVTGPSGIGKSTILKLLLGIFRLEAGTLYARAVLGGAPVLLLDECTSALDAQTERKVLQQLRQLRDRTCVVVTHRPAALELCDWQIELCEGSVVNKREV